MNPQVGMEEKQLKLLTEKQPKIQSSLITNVKSLKQGFRSVMYTSTRSDKTIEPVLKEKTDSHLPAEPENKEADEMNLEDLATIARVVGDEKEESMYLTDSASQLRTSIHQKQQRGPISEDSPRGTEEWLGSGVSATAGSVTTEGTISLNVGSDSNLHFHQGTTSPVANVSAAASLMHPHSAPQSSLGVSPAHPAKNSRFLRGKIKISALKNYVAAIDLGSSSGHQISHEFSRRKDDAPSPSNTKDYARRRDDVDDDFASPQPAEGQAMKIAKKVRNSIIGFVKPHRNVNLILLDDEGTSSTEIGDPSSAPLPTTEVNESSNIFDVADSDTNVKIKTSDRTTASTELLDQTFRQSVKTTQTQIHGNEEAKQRRREKHNQRRARKIDGESNQNSITSSNPTEEAATVVVPRSQLKKTKGRLDAEARERLKKHSEGQEFRNRTTPAQRRLRQQQLETKQSDRSLDRSDASNDLPDSTLATPAKPLLRQSFVHAAIVEPQSSKKPLEALSRRPRNKEEDEKLRERVRSRQSFINANAPKKENSLTLLDILDKKDGDELLSFGGGSAENVGPSLEQESAQADTIAKHWMSSGYLADSSTRNSSLGLISLSADGMGAISQGSFQHVESSRSDDYLQLVIGNVPPKQSSPPPPGAEACDPDPPRRETKLVRKRNGKTGPMDASGHSSEVSRTKTSSRVRGEKRETNSRRKPEGEKTNRSREKSPPRRQSETTGVRRRKEPHRSETGHVSEPTVSTLDDALAVTAERGAELDKTSNLETSSRTHLAGSISNHGASTKANESSEGEERLLSLDALIQVDAKGHELSMTSGIKGTPADPSVDHSIDSSRPHEDKESRRRHHKGAKAKRPDGKTSRSVASTAISKHSSAMPAKPQRLKTRGRVEGALKKAPSTRGRSEKPRRDSRSQLERRVRRHSMDTTTVVKPELASALEVGNSLADIKW